MEDNYTFTTVRCGNTFLVVTTPFTNANWNSQFVSIITNISSSCCGSSGGSSSNNTGGGCGDGNTAFE
jgi:hypothetical protein